MRTALYARFSSDLQSAASIDDQLRDCRAFAARQGWTVVQEYSDHAISGASLFRSGIQALLRDAATGQFDLVVAESLDRLSRDQEDTAGLFKRLTFAGVSIVTLSEGEVSLLHVGLKGTMSALFLKELAEKTRRGLRGRVEAGKSGGGLSYGYRVVTVGEFAIVPEEARVVEDIFTRYVAGQSPKTIAITLNAAGVAGPGGCAWSPSTIHGHAARGTGILNNELYVGRRVWNRLHYLKDPDTGKRVSRLNPRAQWVTNDVPHLRIISDALWAAAKERQAATRQVAQQGLVRARRPLYVFSGLTVCSQCGGGFTLSSRSMLRCFNQTSRGTCANTRTITRQELEGRVLRAIQEKFFAPGVFQAFCDAYVEETNRVRRERRAALANAPKEIASVNRRSNEILELLLNGFRDERWKAELRQIEARRRELEALLASGKTEPPRPALHPHMATVFRERVEQLAAALQQDDALQREQARSVIRSLIEKIEIPAEGLLVVRGNLGRMLTAADGAAAVGQGGCGGGI